MKKSNSFILFVALLFAGPTFLMGQAPDAGKTEKKQEVPTSDGGRKDLKDGATLPDVQQELQSPDGVAIQLMPDGGFRIYARGSGTYDFNEADEIRQATQDATLRAKGAIAKFLKERVQTSEFLENTSVKMKSLSTSNKEEPKAEISKTDVQKRVEQIKSNSDAILSGLVIISTNKKPIGSGGEMQVTVGWSSKTKATAEAIGTNKPIENHSAEKQAGVGTLNNNNVPEVKKNQTDF